MIEHNAANRQQLERLPVDYHVPTTPGRPPGAKDPSSSSQGGPEGEVKGDESSQESGCGLLRGRNTCIKALISLFLKHYHNAEGATIEVRVQTVSIYTCKIYYYTTVHYGGVILVHNGHCQCLECSSVIRLVSSWIQNPVVVLSGWIQNPPFRAPWCIIFASVFGDAKGRLFFARCCKAEEWLVAALAVRCKRGEWLVTFCVVETVPSVTRVTS